jgi:oxygen-dependent protoporphyrinogen oxidase
VGGGISGLAAAFEMCAGTPPDLAVRPEVVVYEESDRLGGRIETTTFADTTIDTGPDSFITRRPAAAELCRQVGLADDLVAPAVSGALVYARGALHPLPERTVLGVPTDLRSLARSGVLTWRGLLRVGADLVLPATKRDPTPGDDPSVAAVLRPRIGGEALALLVDPLIGGINAGASTNLSLRAVAPQIAEATAGGGSSIVRALRSAARGVPAAGGDQAPIFAGMAGGLGRLVQALEEHLLAAGAQIELRAGISALRRVSDRYELVHARGSDLVDGLVLCLPAQAMAGSLAEVAPDAALELGRIRHASVVLVTLSFDPLSVPAGGTGILVPRPFRDVVSAVTFTSLKWPRSSAGGAVIVRASVGSIDDERAVGLGDTDLVVRVREDLRRVTGIDTEPRDVLIRRFPSSFPQYEPGHLARVAAVRSGLERLPGVAIAGAACDGIGIPACVESGRRQAAAVLAEVAVSRARSLN